MRRGLTLLELLISLTVVVVVLATAMRALNSALRFNSTMRSDRDKVAERTHFEDTIIDLLHHAWVSSSTTDENSYFVGEAPSANVVRPTTGGAGAGAGATTNNNTTNTGGVSIGSGTGAYSTPNVMVFTATGLPLAPAYLASNDDFETQNQNFGPQGGPTEVEISQSPVGSSATGKTGLFLRTQVPADNDPTQGGSEQLITPNLSQIGFEFFDGAQWAQSWDSRLQTPAPGRLPAAVRVTYRFTGDTYDHVFVVRIPASDVTYQDPVTVTG
ncbi:MAG TPA: prepilin-type N-terminal cleavage/methylation domain-containing protein [Fimbriimonas sp.]|nr:prepilin-type N-terminal cleavage/methylation domain-containing protein [Fimbriimonas sp.]